MTTRMVYSPEMNRLLNGYWVSQACGNIAREVLLVTIGAGSISQDHLKKRRGSWPRLKPATLADKRKRNKQPFVGSGAVARALVKKPAEGKLKSWGTGANRRIRYSAAGMYAAAGVNDKGFWMMTGFSGQMKNSAGFRKKREGIAISRGVNLSGLSRGGREKAVRRSVSVADTQRALRGSGVKKYATKSKNNLAYANIVQVGPYGSGRTPRELLPYDNGDAGVIQTAIERGVRATLRAEFGGA